MKLENKLSVSLIALFISTLVFVSCEKETITPAKQPEPIDTTKWQDQYTNGGTLPNWNVKPNTNNELVGTNWVLTKIVAGFGSITMNDTIHFIANNKYYVGSDTTNSGLYTLYTSQNNVTLTFKPFIPMNYTQCSTNQLGVGFSKGKNITGVEFVNLYNVTSTFKAWFVKI
jgi:hypothetical protein